MPVRSMSARRKSADPSFELVSDLTGGLDRRSSPTLIAPTRAQQLLNVRLSVPGRWRTRPGWVANSTTSLGAGRPQGGKRVYLEGADPFTVAAWNGSIYTPTDAGVWGAAVVTGYDTAAMIDFPSDSLIVAIFDGVTTPKRSTDGVTWRRLGIAAPTAAGTLSAVAGGSLTSGHVIEISYGYQGELNDFPSNEGPEAQVTVSGGNLTARIVAAASTDPQVIDVVIYARDVTLGESVRRFAGSIANPGVGTVTVNLTSNTWSEETEAPTTHNPAPALEFGVPWKGRWWAKDPSSDVTIRFSEIFLPQAWPVNYTIDLPFTTGDRVTAIIPYGDTLVVMGTSKPAFLIVGITALDFDVRPSAGSQAGAFGPRAWALVEGRIAHAAAEGVYLFDGATDRLMTTDLDQDWRDLVDATTEANLSRVPMVYHDAEKELRIAVPAMPLYGAPGEFVLDITRSGRTPAWSMTDRAIGQYVNWNGPEVATGDRGRLFSLSLTVGRTYEENTGTTANGADTISQYHGPVFTSGLLMARFLALYAEYAPATGSFTLTLEVDDAIVWTGAVTITGSVPLIPVTLPFTLGGGARRVFQTELPLEAEGRGMSLTGTYQGQDAFDWFTYGFSYLPEALPRGL